MYIFTSPWTGFTLEDFDRRHSNTDEMISIFLQCLEALADLHSRNMMHRNIQPKNILISATYKQIRCYVTGLGQVRESCFGGQKDTWDPTWHTSNDNYLAPEVLTLKYGRGPKLNGDMSRYGATLDNFSLGVTLIEAFSGLAAIKIDEDGWTEARMKLLEKRLHRVSKGKSSLKQMTTSMEELIVLREFGEEDNRWTSMEILDDYYEKGYVPNQMDE